MACLGFINPIDHGRLVKALNLSAAWEWGQFFRWVGAAARQLAVLGAAPLTRFETNRTRLLTQDSHPH